METTPLAGTPTPVDSDPDRVPADMKRAFTHIDPLLVLRAANPADRDGRYGNVPRGTIVTGTATDAIWRKATNGWKTVWSDSGWIDVNAVYGWNVVQQIRYRVISDVCYWRGVVSFPPGYTENTWVKICTVPGAAQPASNMRFGMSANSGTADFALAYTDGELQAAATVPNSAAWIGMPPPYPVN